MLEDSFTEVYTKFKLHFYQEIFSAFQDQEAGLSAMETFCMEVILALNEPTVNEFASFVRISSPNAAYKINSLLQKGYLESGSPPATAGNITCALRKNICAASTSAARIYSRCWTGSNAASAQRMPGSWTVCCALWDRS